MKVVSNVAVGYNNIDVAECRERGVIATNTPGVLTEATADIAMALILMVTRRLGEGERIVRSKQPWQWGMFMLLGSGLQGRRLGIVGMGAIGQALAAPRQGLRHDRRVHQPQRGRGRDRSRAGCRAARVSTSCWRRPTSSRSTARTRRRPIT